MIIYFEGGPTGQTVGKSLANLRVISKTTGEPLGYAGACKRTPGKVGLDARRSAPVICGC